MGAHDDRKSPAPAPGSESEDATVAEAASRVASAPATASEQVDNGSAPDETAPGPEAQEPEAAPAPEGPEAPDVAALSAKAEQYLALAQRTQADFENYRKRVAREAAAAQQRGVVKLARELLPAVDNLERALVHADSAPADSADAEGNGSFVAGIKHVHSDVLAAFQRAGIERYSPEGEPFDPQYHEAVAQQPIEGAEPGTIVEVYQRGYRIGESVLRPARVLVAG